MALFVLDASVVISWCFPGDPNEITPYSKAEDPMKGSRQGHPEPTGGGCAIVPEIWAFEIANSIFVSYSKRKRITEQQIREYLSRPYQSASNRRAWKISIWNCSRA